MGKEMAVRWIGPEFRAPVGEYCDPTGAQVISRRLAPDLKARARDAFRRCADQAREAAALAGAGDDNNAYVIWRSIFGDAFPAPAGQTVRTAFAMSFAGVQ